MAFQLVIAAGVGEGRAFKFDRPEARIGRTRDNDVVLDEPGVSRAHARIFSQGGKYFAEDLGSANGTKVNGVRLAHALELENGDTIAVGKVLLAFSMRRSVQPAPPPAKAAAPPSSAATQAKKRRAAKQTAGGRLQLWWQSQPKARRVILLVGFVGSMALLAGLILWPSHPVASTATHGPEPRALSLVRVSDSFGVGENVTWVHANLKAFEFQVTSPTRALVLLHLQAKDIQKGAVELLLNGAFVGSLPTDTHDSAERDIEQVLPAKLLKREGQNRLVIRNVRNPQEHQNWRVWNLWLEIVPVPELPTAELLTSAREDVVKARHFLEVREIGTDNLFKAWKGLRHAWLTLEVVEPRPELYDQTRYELSNVSRELDQQCGKLMLEAQRAMELHRPSKARALLESVNTYFPTPEHPCHNLALEKLQETL